MEQQKYKPYSNTPETAAYASPNTKSIPLTPQGPSYSPLGLADIRPPQRGNMDGPMSPSSYPDNDTLLYPAINNYVAPWPMYALDWCKWTPRSSSGAAGKIALGSYLEDNHNFVRALNDR